MADSSEWQSVRRGRKVSRKSKPPVKKHEEPEDCERNKRRITEAMNELRCEDFWLEWQETLSRCLTKNGEMVSECKCPLECVCYGLGNFSTCVSARYQLAMLLLLLGALQIPVGRCSMYDPVFTKWECETLKDLGFTVLTENEEGKRAVCQPTLFYLIHCGKALYNNLLWRNWNLQVLPKIVIIGNSFNGIQERMLKRELERDYSFLSDKSLSLDLWLPRMFFRRVLNVCEEINLPCSQRFQDVFNDTALITFPSDRLHKVPESIWTEPLEPQYQHCQDIEIIQRGSKS